MVYRVNKDRSKVTIFKVSPKDHNLENSGIKVNNKDCKIVNNHVSRIELTKKMVNLSS